MIVTHARSATTIQRKIDGELVTESRRDFIAPLIMNKRRILFVVSGVILVAASAALMIYLAGGPAAPVSERTTAPKPPADTNAVVARAVAGDHEAELQVGL